MRAGGGLVLQKEGMAHSNEVGEFGIVEFSVYRDSMSKGMQGQDEAKDRQGPSHTVEAPINLSYTGKLLMGVT